MDKTDKKDAHAEVNTKNAKHGGTKTHSKDKPSVDKKDPEAKPNSPKGDKGHKKK